MKKKPYPHWWWSRCKIIWFVFWSDSFMLYARSSPIEVTDETMAAVKELAKQGINCYLMNTKWVETPAKPTIH